MSQTNGSKIMTPYFRISFPHITAPNEDGKYECQMLFPDTADLVPLRRAHQQVAVEAYGDKAKELCGAGKDGNPFKTPEQNSYVPAGFIGLKASTTIKPGVVGPDGVSTVVEGDIYPGAWFRATLEPYAWERSGRKGVSFGLRNLQKIRDDERLDTVTSAADDFDAVETDDAAPIPDSDVDF